MEGSDASPFLYLRAVFLVLLGCNLTPHMCGQRFSGCCETFTMVAVSRGMLESTTGCRGGADIACSHYCIFSENLRLIRRQLLLQIIGMLESTNQLARRRGTQYSTKTNLF